jgi:cytochrome c553
MKHLLIAVALLVSAGVIISCSKKLYTNNGENIYRTGKNLQGEKLLDKKNSQITLFKSCAGCHGKSGERMKACNIKWSYLSDPGKMTVPYTEELFNRFLKKDLKSDGTPARTGVHWAMSQADKTDLLSYLKSLK